MAIRNILLDTNAYRVDQLVVDDGTAEHYAAVYRELRRRGRPIPTNDMWIAATALQHGLVIFSDDGHFHEVPGLSVGTRLADFMFLKAHRIDHITSNKDQR